MVELSIIETRQYVFIDEASFVEVYARDTLLKSSDGSYFLHLTSRAGLDRVIHLGLRSALAWINAPPEELGLERV
jgi:hypothetical protein